MQAQRLQHERANPRLAKAVARDEGKAICLGCSSSVAHAAGGSCCQAVAQVEGRTCLLAHGTGCWAVLASCAAPACLPAQRTSWAILKDSEGQGMPPTLICS